LSFPIPSPILPECHSMTHNGPAIKGGCVTRRKHRAGSLFFSQKAVTVQGGYGTRFCRHGRNNFELYECRGTRLLSGRKAVLVAKI